MGKQPNILKDSIKVSKKTNIPLDKVVESMLDMNNDEIETSLSQIFSEQTHQESKSYLDKIIQDHKIVASKSLSSHKEGDILKNLMIKSFIFTKIVDNCPNSNVEIIGSFSEDDVEIRVWDCCNKPIDISVGEKIINFHIDSHYSDETEKLEKDEALKEDWGELEQDLLNFHIYKDIIEIRESCVFKLLQDLFPDKKPYFTDEENYVKDSDPNNHDFTELIEYMEQNYPYIEKNTIQNFSINYRIYYGFHVKQSTHKTHFKGGVREANKYWEKFIQDIFKRFGDIYDLLVDGDGGNMSPLDQKCYIIPFNLYQKQKIETNEDLSLVDDYVIGNPPYNVGYIISPFRNKESDINILSGSIEQWDTDTEETYSFAFNYSPDYMTAKKILLARFKNIIIKDISYINSRGDETAMQITVGKESEHQIMIEKVQQICNNLFPDMSLEDKERNIANEYNDDLWDLSYDLSNDYIWNPDTKMIINDMKPYWAKHSHFMKDVSQIPMIIALEILEKFENKIILEYNQDGYNYKIFVLKEPIKKIRVESLTPIIDYLEGHNLGGVHSFLFNGFIEQFDENGYHPSLHIDPYNDDEDDSSIRIKQNKDKSEYLEIYHHLAPSHELAKKRLESRFEGIVISKKPSKKKGEVISIVNLRNKGTSHVSLISSLEIINEKAKDMAISLYQKAEQSNDRDKSQSLKQFIKDLLKEAITEKEILLEKYNEQIFKSFKETIMNGIKESKK